MRVEGGWGREGEGLGRGVEGLCNIFTKYYLTVFVKTSRLRMISFLLAYQQRHMGAKKIGGTYLICSSTQLTNDTNRE